MDRREHETADELAAMSDAGRAAILRARKRRGKAAAKSGAGPDAADFRPEAEDDDGYDPYSDYMDALNRSEGEELSEDPWR